MKTNLPLDIIAEQAIQTAAMRRGISVNDVRREISLAILLSQPKDASVMQNTPSPEELISYCVSRLQL